MSVFSDQFLDYGPGRLTPNSGLALDDLQSRLKKYRRTVAKRYRIVEPEKIDRFLPEGKLWLSTKIDGQLWFLVKRDGEVALCSYNGRVMQGVPVVDEAEKLLKERGDLIIAGELFALPPQGEGRPRVHHVNRALGVGDLAKTLGFKAFDLVEEGDEDKLLEDYDVRFERLKELLAKGRRCAPVTTVEGDAKDVANYYQEWVRSKKFEGIVARSEHGLTYKIKPTMDVDAVVIAYGETQNNGVDQIRELTVALQRDDGSFHILGTVGNGFSDEDRIAWHRRLSEMQVGSSFRMANREGTLCRFIRPEIVIEIKVSDLMETDSADMPVRRMVLAYDEESGYSTRGPMPIPSLIFPIFVRERADKSVDVGSIGLDQVYRYIPFQARHEEPEVVDLSSSEIVERKVYTKTRKDSLYVRKYVVIKTNKDEEDQRFPGWVVYFTDYSPNRKDPLKTNLRVGPNKEEIDEHIGAWIDKNIKRGWSEYETEA